MGLDRGFVYPKWAGRFGAPADGPAEDFRRYHGQTVSVVRVVDGDTLHIDVPGDGSLTEKVRLLGIDAPEMAAAESEPRHFALESAEAARQLVGGRKIALYLDERHATRGKYGRLLAYVELPDGTLLNEWLISHGYAYADQRFQHSYYQKYRQLEAAARARNRGLWARVRREDLPDWLRRIRPDFSP
ncbi:MAG: thermonuclease family protein [Sedimentisphaerales bacterium]|nr:thermonuclease family protein [Sedimentisphaerales bacterium]